jgi:5-methylcytosine-specific restriction endonuclease McrA
MKYTKEKLQEAVDNSKSLCDVLRYFGTKASGGNISYMSSRLKKFNIDTSHFTGQGWNKNGTALNRRSAKEILIKSSKGYREKHKNLKRAMIESGIDYVCSNCKLDEWLGQEIVLDVDHINEDWSDNRLKNLQFLCPNCHRVKI